MQARSGLFKLLDALRIVLVLEHEGMTTALAVVHAEGISGKQSLEARVIVQL